MSQSFNPGDRVRLNAPCHRGVLGTVVRPLEYCKSESESMYRKAKFDYWVRLDDRVKCAITDYPFRSFEMELVA